MMKLILFFALVMCFLELIVSFNMTIEYDSPTKLLIGFLCTLLKAVIMFCVYCAWKGVMIV